MRRGIPHGLFPCRGDRRPAAGRPNTSARARGGGRGEPGGGGGVGFGKPYANPFTDAQLDALVTQPDGTRLRAPGFWAGGSGWRFRYASNTIGTHTWRTECSDTADSGLHGLTGSVTVTASTSANPLFLHGPIRVAADQRHFEHIDGTPFLWLGDTWWKGLCKRMTWDGFQQLTADRQAKGFNVVGIAGYKRHWRNLIARERRRLKKFSQSRIFHLTSAQARCSLPLCQT